MITKNPNLNIKFDIENNRPPVSIDKEHNFIKEIVKVLEDMSYSIDYKGIKFYTNISQIVPYHPVPFVILGPGEEGMAHHGALGSSFGVFLYFNKYVDKGWYGTYVPVVSVGPACVLMFGASINAAIIAGILGGIIGPPLAEYFCDKLPEGYHPTIGNVTSMGVTTIVVSIIIKVLPWI